MDAIECPSPPSRRHRPSIRQSKQQKEVATSGQPIHPEPPQNPSKDSFTLPQASLLPLDGLSVSVSGCLGQKSNLLGLAEELGAERHEKLYENTTHLVTDKAEGNKYETALERGMAIMSPRWLPVLREVWNRRKGLDLEELERRNRLLPLHGVVFALTQFDPAGSDDFRSLVIRNGATFSSEFNSDVTHLIVASAPLPYDIVHSTSKLYRARSRPQHFHPCLKVVWEGWVSEVIRIGGRRGAVEEFWSYVEGRSPPAEDPSGTVDALPLRSTTTLPSTSAQPLPSTSAQPSQVLPRHTMQSSPRLPLPDPNLSLLPPPVHPSDSTMDIDAVPRPSSSPLNSTPPRESIVPSHKSINASSRPTSTSPLPLGEAPLADLLSQVQLSPAKAISRSPTPSRSSLAASRSSPDPRASPRSRSTPRVYQQREDPLYQQLQNRIFDAIDSLDWIDGVGPQTVSAVVSENAKKMQEVERERILGQKGARFKEENEKRRRKPSRRQKHDLAMPGKVELGKRTTKGKPAQQSRPTVALTVPASPATSGVRRNRSRSSDREALLAVTDGPSPSKRGKTGRGSPTKGSGKENEN